MEKLQKHADVTIQPNSNHPIRRQIPTRAKMIVRRLLITCMPDRRALELDFSDNEHNSIPDIRLLVRTPTSLAGRLFEPTRGGSPGRSIALVRREPELVAQSGLILAQSAVGSQSPGRRDAEPGSAGFEGCSAAAIRGEVGVCDLRGRVVEWSAELLGDGDEEGTEGGEADDDCCCDYFGDVPDCGFGREDVGEVRDREGVPEGGDGDSDETERAHAEKSEQLGALKFDAARDDDGHEEDWRY